MKFIRSTYDPETKLSEVIIRHKGKKFVGYSKPADEDYEIANELRGGTIAEIKATIKALQYELKELKKEDRIINKYFCEILIRMEEKGIEPQKDLFSITDRLDDINYYKRLRIEKEIQELKNDLKIIDNGLKVIKDYKNKKVKEE